MGQTDLRLFQALALRVNDAHGSCAATDVATQVCSSALHTELVLVTEPPRETGAVPSELSPRFPRLLASQLVSLASLAGLTHPAKRSPEHGPTVRTPRSHLKEKSIRFEV